MRLTSSIERGPDLAHTAFHEPFESVEDANHVATAEHASDRDRTNHTIDAGAGPPRLRYRRSCEENS